MFALLIFVACSKDDTVVPETPETPETLVTIIFSNTALESMLLDSSRDHTPSVIDSDGDGAISLDEVEAVTKIDATGASTQSKLATISKSSSLTLTSLDDIFNFENLVELDCSGNEITTIDLSANSALETMNCSNNAVTEITISSNSSLISLDCSTTLLRLSIYHQIALLRLLLSLIMLLHRWIYQLIPL